MSESFKKLLEPFSVRGVYFRNRIFLPPCAIAHVNEGAPNDLGVAYLEEKARGGAAQITQGNITGPGGHGDNGGHLNRYNTNWKTQMAFTELAYAIKQHGAVASAEVNHAGCNADYESNYFTQPMGPVGFVRPDGIEVKEMDEDMIYQTVDYYVEIATFLKDSGFQMCMIHSAHDMLLNQFLSPRYNSRKDKYGGSIEGRMQFPLMVVKAIREAVGEDFPLELRIGLEHTPDGNMLDELVYFAQAADPYIDFVNVSGGTGLDHWTQSINYMPEAVHLPTAKALKAAGIKAKVVLLGGIVSPEVGEQILEEGHADVIGMARALMADPQLPNKLRRGEPEEVVPCLRCQNCLAGEKIFYLTRCMVNPSLGHEARYVIPRPVTKKRRVLVVGGGPAGMMAAITAAERGHEVILADNESELGGTIRFSAHDPHKVQLYKYMKYLIRQVEKNGIEVYLNTTVDEAFIKEIAPESMIVAAGAAPVVPKIPGIDGENVIYATEAYYHPEKVGKNVVIIGGGQVGCEVGATLASEGHSVKVIEMTSDLASEDNRMHRGGLMWLWEQYDITAYTDTAVTEITPEGCKAKGPDGADVFFAADTVIYAVGLRPRQEVFLELRRYCDDTVSCGDCVKSGKIVDATTAGYNTAVDLA